MFSNRQQSIRAVCHTSFYVLPRPSAALLPDILKENTKLTSMIALNINSDESALHLSTDCSKCSLSEWRSARRATLHKQCKSVQGTVQILQSHSSFGYTSDGLGYHVFGGGSQTDKCTSHAILHRRGQGLTTAPVCKSPLCRSTRAAHWVPLKCWQS